MGRSWKIGAVEIHQVVEIVAPTPLGMLFPDASPERLEPLSDWLRPYFLDDQGNMILSIHAFAIRSGDARIIVDTCLGNGKTRPIPDWSDLETTFLSDLEAAGFPPASVDRVLCTHLHFDHVGWNTVRRDGKWVPTFPNARYLVGEREWAHWEEEDDPFAPQAKQDSILPIFDAGLVDLVQPDHRVNEEIELIPTPGHTPGHVSVWIRSQGAEAVITGDMFHHPFQLSHPDWTDVADVDGDQAHRTRIEFCRRFGDRPVLILGTHFAQPTAGRIVSDGDSYRLDY